MKRLVAGLILGLMLVGCAHKPDIPVGPPRIISACPEPPEFSRPLLPLRNLNTESSVEDILKAYVTAIALLMSYSEELEKLLEGYKVLDRGI